MEAWIPSFWAGAVLIIGGTGADSVCSFSLWYESEEPVSVAGCYAAPFVAQMCQRGHSMGRGQVQGPHAKTSGT